VSARSFGSTGAAGAYFVRFLGQASAICEALAAEGAQGGNIRGQEVLAMAQVIGRLATNFGRDMFHEVDTCVQGEFLSAATQLTTLALHRMTEEDNDDPLFTEAFDQCLSVWLTLVEGGAVDSAWSQASLQVNARPSILLVSLLTAPLYFSLSIGWYHYDPLDAGNSIGGLELVTVLALTMLTYCHS